MAGTTGARDSSNALCSVKFSPSVMSDSLQPHGMQHARPPYLSPTPGVYQTHHQVGDAIQHLILCRPLLLLPPIPPRIRLFSNKSALRMRWPKFWSFSFSISPSNEHPGLISVRMDWLDLFCRPRDSQESSPTPQFKSISSSALSFLYTVNLTSVHDHWKNHSLD